MNQLYQFPNGSDLPIDFTVIVIGNNITQDSSWTRMPDTMPVEVDFDGTENVYIHFLFQTPWTFKDFRDAQKIAHAWARNLDYIVDAVLDFADTSALPSHAISEGLEAIERTQKQPNIGHTVVFTRSNLVQRMVQIIAHLAPSYGLRVVQEIHEAEQVIAHAAREQSFFTIVHPGKYTILALN